MKVISPLPTKRGRLEIIPLIDIMFFLLAAFMLVSIDKIRVKSLKVNLPTNVPTAQIEKKEDFISVSINADGHVQIGQDLITDKQQVLPKLQALYAQNKEQKFLISADKDARNGDVISVLGQLRAAGFQKVAFSTSSVPAPAGGVSTSPNVGAPATVSPPAPAAEASTPSNFGAPAPVSPPAPVLGTPALAPLAPPAETSPAQTTPAQTAPTHP